MENIWMSLTNLYALRAIYSFYLQDKLAPTLVLTGAMLSSMMYHLIENQKHQMPGIGIANAPYWNSAYINLDRYFAFLSALTLFSWPHFKVYQFYCVASFASMTISETLFRQEKYFYLIFHTIWHLSIFHIAWLFSLPLP